MTHTNSIAQRLSDSRCQAFINSEGKIINSECKLQQQATNPKSSASLATVSPSLQPCIVLKNSYKIYVWSVVRREQCLSITNLLWRCLGSLPKCRHFLSLLIGPFLKTVISLPEPLSKHLYFTRKFSKSTGQLVTKCRHSPFIGVILKFTQVLFMASGLHGCYFIHIYMVQFIQMGGGFWCVQCFQ